MQPDYSRRNVTRRILVGSRDEGVTKPPPKSIGTNRIKILLSDKLMLIGYGKRIDSVQPV